DIRCFVVVKLDLIVNTWPTVGPMTPLVVCMDVPTTTYRFNLHDKDAQALGTQNPNDFKVKYYRSEEEANEDLNPLPYTYENSELIRQTIWVRVENKKTGCFNIASLLLQIEDAVYAFQPGDTTFCNSDFVNDGVSLVD